MNKTIDLTGEKVNIVDVLDKYYSDMSNGKINEIILQSKGSIELKLNTFNSGADKDIAIFVFDKNSTCDFKFSTPLPNLDDYLSSDPIDATGEIPSFSEKETTEISTLWKQDVTNEYNTFKSYCDNWSKDLEKELMDVCGFKEPKTIKNTLSEDHEQLSSYIKDLTIENKSLVASNSNGESITSTYISSDKYNVLINNIGVIKEISLTETDLVNYLLKNDYNKFDYELTQEGQKLLLEYEKSEDYSHIQDALLENKNVIAFNSNHEAVTANYNIHLDKYNVLIDNAEGTKDIILSEHELITYLQDNDYNKFDSCNLTVAEEKFAKTESADIKLNVSDIKEVFKNNIVTIYSKELPAIKHITENTANTICNLNKTQGHILTIKELRGLHTIAGHKVETSKNQEDMKDYKVLREVVDDIKHAELVEKQEKAHEKALENPKSKNIEMVQ
ncbi:hypothetical protein [Clostridium estertheticum]|uniref:hypothetical protein n=1 Tax=Clostridium estertheticum TaxID=238834 RepID=UPI001C0BF23D|nr:hypothetical protein [Clostridium estertheticum]MBU3173360.1 hypothetical protein [Clostridium estertheticum]